MIFCSPLNGDGDHAAGLCVDLLGRSGTAREPCLVASNDLPSAHESMPPDVDYSVACLQPKFVTPRNRRTVSKRKRCVPSLISPLRQRGHAWPGERGTSSRCTLSCLPRDTPAAGIAVGRWAGDGSLNSALILALLTVPMLTEKSTSNLTDRPKNLSVYVPCKTIW